MIRDYVYTIEETADLMEVNRSTVYRWLRAGRLPGEDIGGVVLIPRWAVEIIKEERDAKRSHMISGSFYTIGEAAAQLGRHRNTIARWGKEGRLPITRLGNTALIRKEDVDRLKAQAHIAEA